MQNAARFPCGKIDLRADPTAQDVVLRQRMKEMVRRGALHQKWVCYLWQLHDDGRISESQRKAGDAYVKLVEEHRKAIGAQPPVANVAKLERGYGKLEIDLDVLDVEQCKEYQDKLRASQDAYDKVFLLLVPKYTDIRMKRAVDSVCFNNEPADIATVREGLDLLAQHFGLTTRTKRD